MINELTVENKEIIIKWVQKMLKDKLNRENQDEIGICISEDALFITIQGKDIDKVVNNDFIYNTVMQSLNKSLLDTLKIEEKDWEYINTEPISIFDNKVAFSIFVDAEDDNLYLTDVCYLAYIIQCWAATQPNDNNFYVNLVTHLTPFFDKKKIIDFIEDSNVSIDKFNTNGFNKVFNNSLDGLDTTKIWSK